LIMMKRNYNIRINHELKKTECTLYLSYDASVCLPR
jgi:hypothetical protein